MVYSEEKPARAGKVTAATRQPPLPWERWIASAYGESVECISAWLASAAAAERLAQACHVACDVLG